MARTPIPALAFAAAMLFAAVPASAQVVHSVQVGFGGVFPRGLDARSNDDVIRRNIAGEAMRFDPTVSDRLAIRVGDFRSAQLFGEWNVAFGPHVEVGAGLGYYRRTVPSLYGDVVDEQGFDIEQEIRLRVVPVNVLVRFLPFGRPGEVQPYVGAGLSVMRFRYSEIGDFVDPDTGDIFNNLNDPYVATGTSTGSLLLAGLRVPLGGDIYGMAIEGRYVVGKGKLSTDTFVAEEIDLGGGQFNVTFLVRF
jgi:hypothetical protein